MHRVLLHSKRWVALTRITGTVAVMLLIVVQAAGATTAAPLQSAPQAPVGVSGHHHPQAAALAGEPPLLPGPSEPTNQGPFFQLICTLGARMDDDPIVFPRQPGAAHEHQFFGAKAVDAFATYERVRSGGTTCADAGDTASYWVPALYDEQGLLRSPKRLRVYYYANSTDRAALQAFPPNLRMIAGDARATSVQPQGVINWLCRKRANQSAGYDLASAYPPRCDRDAYLSLSIRFPDCWDGQNLDSSDHRRHMAYADARTRCPASHPVKLPKLRMSITYETAPFVGGNFTLGDPRGALKALPWMAMHADFWNTWQQDALEKYVVGCLQQGRNVRVTACQ